MSKKPLISIIIPTYNRAHYLQQAIKSVLNQTFKDIEIIIVDDGSTDHTKEIVSPYSSQYPNIIRYMYQSNSERASARNNGIKHAKGEYIALLDSDDEWLPLHLETCFETLRKNPGSGLSFSNSYLIDLNSSIFSKKKSSLPSHHILKHIISHFSAGGCNASSCLIKREIFNKTGYFDEDRNLSGSEDWELWARIANVTSFQPTHHYTAKIRVHKNQSSFNAKSMEQSMLLAFQKVFKNLDLLPKIQHLKQQALSHVFTIIAITYYATGDMKTCRAFLKNALITWPSIMVSPRFGYTFLRSCLGSSISKYIRSAKEKLGIKNYNEKSTLTL